MLLDCNEPGVTYLRLVWKSFRQQGLKTLILFYLSAKLNFPFPAKKLFIFLWNDIKMSHISNWNAKKTVHDFVLMMAHTSSAFFENSTFHWTFEHLTKSFLIKSLDDVWLIRKRCLSVSFQFLCGCRSTFCLWRGWENYWGPERTKASQWCNLIRANLFECRIQILMKVPLPWKSTAWLYYLGRLTLLTFKPMSLYQEKTNKGTKKTAMRVPSHTDPAHTVHAACDYCRDVRSCSVISHI